MPVVAKRYKIRFEENALQFSETYPEALEGVLAVPEFDSVIRKINEDLTMEVQARGKKVKRWAYICLGLCILLAGLCLTPVLFVQTRRQRRELKHYWERVRAYLGEINRKTYLKRNLEWKLVEDRHKLKTRDVVNPLLAFRIELVHRIQRGGKASAVRHGDDSGAGAQFASTTGFVSGSGSTSISKSVSKSPSSSASRTAMDSGSSKNKPPFSINSFANTEPVASSATAGLGVGVGVAASAATVGIIIPSKAKHDQNKDEDEDEDDSSDSDIDQVEEDDDKEFNSSGRFSHLSEDIILEDVSAEEEGEMESANLASISSSTGVGSYSRGSLINTPMNAAIAASVLTLASSERQRAEKVKATADHDSDVTIPLYLFQEPSLQSSTRESSIISVPLALFAEDEAGNKVKDDEATHGVKDDAEIKRSERSSEGPSKVRFTGLFDDDEPIDMD